MVGVVATLACLTLATPPGPATAAVSPEETAPTGEVLILASTVTGGASSIEADQVRANGLAPVMVSDDTWSTMTTAQFARYRAVVLGDPTCGSHAPAVAEDNAAVWGSAITGNVVINGTDPVYHAHQGGESAVRRFIDYAVANPGKTGASISLSCYNHGALPGTPVKLLDALRPGGFTVRGVGCYDNAHIVATHPALNGLTDRQLSNWGCSVHEAFDSYPADYQVLAIARDIGSTFTAADGSVGTPYILASGGGLRSFPLSLDPVSSTGAAGSRHTLTATLLDKATREPVAGQKLSFAVIEGPNTGTTTGRCPTGNADCTTDNAGDVSWSYASNSKNGEDRVAAWIDQDGDGAIDSGEPQTFAARTWIGPARALRYVALGDSFQSGEGAYEYQDGTDTDGTNECHRSDISYPYLIADEDGVPPVTQSYACSGAVVGNLYGGQWNEPAQFSHLDGDVRLVTVGIGGNDMGFGPIITACVKGPQLSGDFFRATQTCHGRFEDQIQTSLKDLTGRTKGTDGRSMSRLERVYDRIAADTDGRARVLVLGYPRFFVDGGNFFGCKLVYRVDQNWINDKIDEFNAQIEQAAERMGAEFAVDGDVFLGNELCSDGEEYLNGIVGLGDSESFHPNAAGHREFARALTRHIQGPAAGKAFTIDPFETIYDPFRVLPGSGSVTFGTSWPGSDVVMTLTDPSGRTYTRETVADDVYHRNGPVSEVYTITDPVPGEWTVSLYGADVVEDEPVRLVTSVQERDNVAPIARATAVTSTSATTVTYDATASSDEDGRVVSYEWDFGDGTAATGPLVTHTYDNLGHLNQPSLRVVDDRGATDYLDLPHVVVHYGFGGFDRPVQDGTARVTAGQALPIKFRLAKPDGSPQAALSAVASFAASRPGATFALTHDGEKYELKLNTPRSWEPGPVTVTITLDDNSSRTIQLDVKR